METKTALPELTLATRLALLDQVGFGVWVFDGEDTRFVNRALSEITGYSKEELIQPKFFEQLIHPEFHDLLLERGQKRVRGEDVPAEYTIAVVTREGQKRWLALHAQRIELESGFGSLVSATDVTELRRAEYQIRQGEDIVRNLLDLIPAHIIATDAQGKPTFVNQHWLLYTGMTMEQALADGTAPVIHPDDVRRATKEWNEAKASCQGYDIDYRIRDFEGQYCWHNFRIRPLFAESEVLAGWISVAINVDAARSLEAGLLEATDRLAEANRMKDEILGLVSHELRTPLTTLKGNASVLRRYGDTLDDELRATALMDIERDADRLRGIVENMLVLARHDEPAGEEFEPMLLRHLLAAEVAEHQARHPSANIELIVPDQRFPAYGNETYFRQVVSNLISNALKYGKAGAPVEVSVRSLDDFVAVSVSDRGAGLSPDLIERVFEPFFRAPPALQSPGVGLGLAVCRRLVERQGGRIWAEAREGGGTTFTFTLPAASAFDD